VDMNTIKYATAMEIEKVCKRNKQIMKREERPECQQQIADLLNQKDESLVI